MGNEAIKLGIQPVLDTILIVDDEEAIRRSLEGVFCDEGYSCVAASHGAEALAMLEDLNRQGRLPALVLLDIWLPGMDGIEVLQRMKRSYPALPVIMISGHATIATAMQATRIGAADFIEKPLDLEATLAAVKKVRDGSANTGPVNGAHQETDSAPATELLVGRSTGMDKLDRVAFVDRQGRSAQGWRGPAVIQRTLRGSAVLYGHGVHSGRKSGLILEPLPANSGIHFVGVSAEQKPVPAHVEFVDSTGWATTIRLGQTQAGTIEHLMSALHAYGISNLLIKCNGEVPVVDGSALEFCNLIEETGLKTQPGEWFAIEVRREITVSKGKEFIKLEPADKFSVEYTLEYPAPVGRQHYCFTFGEVDEYKEQIAPARTFGFVKDIGALQQRGLALGGRFDNFVLIGEEGAINAELRFPDEAVRHKILDVIGDLYLLGRPIRGKITASMTGHSDNIALLKQLRAEIQKDL